MSLTESEALAVALGADRLARRVGGMLVLTRWKLEAAGLSANAIERIYRKLEAQRAEASEPT